MQAVRFETTVDENGEVRLTRLPFRAGERVEIIVLQQAPRGDSVAALPLRGVAIEYERPTDPVAEEATADHKIVAYPHVQSLRMGG